MSNVLTDALYEGARAEGYAIALTAAYDLADGEGVRCKTLGVLEASETGDDSPGDWFRRLAEILKKRCTSKGRLTERQWELEESLLPVGAFRLIGPRKGMWAVLTVKPVKTAFTGFALNKLIEPCEEVRVGENILDELYERLQGKKITQEQYATLAGDESLGEMADSFRELRAKNDGEWSDLQYVIDRAIEDLPDGPELAEVETPTAGAEPEPMGEAQKGAAEPEETAAPIREYAYRMYAAHWIATHESPEEILDTMRDYWDDSKSLTDTPLTLDEYVQDIGFKGELYVCREEFLENEYLDEGFIRELLGNDGMIAEYEADIKALKGEPDGKKAEAPSPTGEVEFFSSDTAVRDFLDGKTDAPLNFPACCFLLDEAAKCGVVMRDPEESANILVYRKAGDENHPEGWYSENLMSAAGELADSPEGQRLMRNAILKARADKEAD